MKNLIILAFLLSLVGCNPVENGLPTVPVANAQQPSKTQSENEKKAERMAEPPKKNKPVVGTVARVNLDDNERQDNLNNRLHFCVFENGDSDYIYVGTKYGMWSRGEFDFSIDGKIIFTGKIDHLVYEGVVLGMGDVLTEQPKSSIGVHITRVTGMFK